MGFDNIEYIITGPRVDPENAGEILYLLLFGNTSGFTRKSRKMLPGIERCQEYHAAPHKDAWMTDAL